MITPLLVVVISFGISTSPAFAAERDFEQCRPFFVNNTPPVIQHQIELQPQALCFSAFAVMHSGNSHTPIYVAEKLNKEMLRDAQGNGRTNQFYEEARLPQAERAQLEDYRGSGFDRGHLAFAVSCASTPAFAESELVVECASKTAKSIGPPLVERSRIWAKLIFIFSFER